MNWEAIGTVAEVVGAVAIVLSLIYVATQIKQNTAASRAQSLGARQRTDRSVRQ